mmetsp:Transcript_40683/g.91468  ORF Transcript_40683/g.91468 Transcript_40683/m.91468 type:complete len:203 (-) Transcript_40683:284-892(-)
MRRVSGRLTSTSSPAGRLRRSPKKAPRIRPRCHLEGAPAAGGAFAVLAVPWAAGVEGGAGRPRKLGLTRKASRIASRIPARLPEGRALLKRPKAPNAPNTVTAATAATAATRGGGLLGKKRPSRASGLAGRPTFRPKGRPLHLCLRAEWPKGCAVWLGRGPWGTLRAAERERRASLWAPPRIPRKPRVPRKPRKGTTWRRSL